MARLPARPLEGSTYPRKSDGRWVAQLPRPGHPARPERRYARTEAEAREILAGMIRDRDAGRTVRDSRQPLDAYLAWWLKERSEVGERPPLRRATLAAA